MKSDAEVLQDSITFLEGETGWCKNSFFRDEDGMDLNEDQASYATTYCLEGALKVACGHSQALILGDTEAQAASAAQFNRIRKNLVGLLNKDPEVLGLNRSDWIAIPQFNDAEKTTKEDALRLLKFGMAEADEWTKNEDEDNKSEV